MEGFYLIKALVSGEDVQSYLRVTTEYFDDEERDLYEKIKKHLIRYQSLPSMTLIESTFPAVAGVKVTEPAEYYAAKVKERWQRDAVIETLHNFKDHIKANRDNPQASIDYLKRAAIDMDVQINPNKLIEFTSRGMDLLKTDRVTHELLGAQYGVMSGWPTFDEMTGGLKGGDLVSIVGKTEAGKSMLLAYMLHAAFKQKKVPFYISMEMNSLLVSQRLAAMFMKYPLSHIQKHRVSTRGLQRIENFTERLKRPDLPDVWIADGNFTVNIDDILLMVSSIKPDVVYLDGGYLVKPSDPNLRGWEGHEENIKTFKGRIATEMDIPVVVTYQFTKEGAKAKDSKKVDTTDIGGSVAIGQTSSIVIGLFDNNQNIPSTAAKRECVMLKGRSGEKGQWTINWNFRQMDFNEWEAQEISEDKL